MPREQTFEAIGDCLELIHKEKTAVHHFLIQLRALSTVFWAVVFSFKELLKSGALLAAIWRFLMS